MLSDNMCFCASLLLRLTCGQADWTQNGGSFPAAPGFRAGWACRVWWELPPCGRAGQGQLSVRTHRGLGLVARCGQLPFTLVVCTLVFLCFS